MSVRLNMLCLCLPTALIMSSVMQKLISPVAGSSVELPKNKVTVVGVGQVGMACAVSILLRVRNTQHLHRHLYRAWLGALGCCIVFACVCVGASV